MRTAYSMLMVMAIMVKMLMEMTMAVLCSGNCKYSLGDLWRVRGGGGAIAAPWGRMGDCSPLRGGVGG